MSFTIYDATIPPMIGMLQNLSKIIDKAVTQAKQKDTPLQSLLDARLAASHRPISPELAQQRAALINRYGPLFRGRQLVCKNCLGLRYGEVKWRRQGPRWEMQAAAYHAARAAEDAARQAAEDARAAEWDQRLREVIPPEALEAAERRIEEHRRKQARRVGHVPPDSKVAVIRRLGFKRGTGLGDRPRRAQGRQQVHLLLNAIFSRRLCREQVKRPLKIADGVLKRIHLVRRRRRFCVMGDSRCQQASLLIMPGNLSRIGSPT